MNLIKIGFWNFARAKGNIILSIISILCFTVLEITDSFQSIMSLNGSDTMDKLSFIMQTSFELLSKTILILMLIAVPFVSVLKIKDNSKQISLLKAIGYTNDQITVIQLVEHFLIFVFVYFASVILSGGFMLLINSTAFDQQQQIGVETLLSADRKMLLFIGIIFIIITLFTLIEIKMIKPSKFNQLES